MAFSVLMWTVTPAIAADQDTPASIPTHFTVNSGQGTPPLVKAKWEEEKADPYLESGDRDHEQPGTQILPPLVKGAKKTITICAIVTDEEGLDTIATVKAWVEAPHVDKYCNGGFGGPFILNEEYKPQTQANDAKARFQQAYNAGLTTINTNAGINYAEIMQELDNGSAAIYCGDFQLDYEDPAGDYTITVRPQDTSAQWGSLSNDLTYVGVAGFEVDFDSIDYKTVNIGVEKMVDGDYNFDLGDGLPTVRSIGNVLLNLTIKQDAMGLPLESDVHYAARMGNTSATRVDYDPNQLVTLPDVLGLSSESKMDFWITVYETAPDTDSYNGTMTLGCVPVDFPSCG